MNISCNDIFSTNLLPILCIKYFEKPFIHSQYNMYGKDGKELKQFNWLMPKDFKTIFPTNPLFYRHLTVYCFNNKIDVLFIFFLLLITHTPVNFSAAPLHLSCDGLKQLYKLYEYSHSRSDRHKHVSSERILMIINKSVQSLIVLLLIDTIVLR